MKNIIIIIICAAVGAILINFLLSTFGFDFNKGVVGGISGAVVGGWASSYLNKNK